MIWRRKTERKLPIKPKLASLPSTTEVFKINVFHFQVCNWISWMFENLPNTDPCEVSISNNKILFLNSYSKIILAYTAFGYNC